MKAVIFIESNTTGTGRIMAELAKTKNFHVIFLVSRAEKYSFLKDYFHQEVDTTNHHALSSLVKEIASDYQISAITSTSEYFIETASILAKSLNLPSLDPSKIQHCRDKYTMRKLIQEGTSEDVPNMLIHCASDAKSNIPQSWYPVVVKPRSGSGSCAVQLCNNDVDVKKALNTIDDFLQNQNKCLNNTGGLVEKYIDGQEYSVECFNGEIIGITKKHVTGAPYFVESGHDFNTKISNHESQLIQKKTMRLIELLDINWGPLHVELKCDGQKVYIIEVNPRLAGGMIPVLIENTLGINLVDAWLDNSLNKQPELSATKNIEGAIRFLIPKETSTIHESINTNLIATEQADLFTSLNIKEVALYHPTGTTITPHGDFKDRIGHIIVAGENLDFDELHRFRDSILERVIHARAE